jgi:hypothetical protein
MRKRLGYALQMITASVRVRQIARLAIALVLALAATEGTAFAQLEKRFAVGVSIGKTNPTDDDLSTKTRVIPTISRVPRPGWGIALGLNWFEADVDGDFVDLGDRLGKVNVRPFMAGIGYTAFFGKLSVNPTIVAGPSWNRFEVDEEWRDLFAVGGDDPEDKTDVFSFAVRPGISATYAVHPRFGITAFGGYLFNRPDFTFFTPGGERDTPWKTDGFSFSAGVVVPIF